VPSFNLDWPKLATIFMSELSMFSTSLLGRTPPPRDLPRISRAIFRCLVVHPTSAAFSTFALRTEHVHHATRKPTAKAAMTKAPPKKPVAGAASATKAPASRAKVAKSPARKPTAKTAMANTSLHIV
jgi:hypothetical protein